MAGEEKIYVGNGKIHNFPDGGSQIKLRLTLDGLKELHEKYGFTTDAGKHILTLIVNEKRNVDQYGNTHTLTVDTWKPDSARSNAGNNSGSSAPNKSEPEKNNTPQDDSDIPF
jgi:hypothetical protein